LVAWSLHGEVIHGGLAFILQREHAYGGGAHLEEEGRIYYPSFAHEERRTCQIRMRSDALGEESLGACFCGERLSVSGSVYLL
jgi:hypothetical protein